MFFVVDIVRLVQMLGISLGIGAQTVMLIAYLSSARDGVIDRAEAQFARAVRWIMGAGLFLILVSGVVSIIIDVAQLNAAVFAQPAYIFKWMLIASVFGLSFLPLQNVTAEGAGEGIAGGTWYALFVVHVLAPVASWINLFTLYVVWMIGFYLCWAVLRAMTVQKEGAWSTGPGQAVREEAPPARIQKAWTPPPAPAPKPPPPPPKVVPAPPPPVVKPLVTAAPPPKPVAPPPPHVPVQPQQTRIVQTLPQPRAPEPPPPPPEQNPWLPAIHVMPKTEDDAQKRLNAGLKLS